MDLLPPPAPTATAHAIALGTSIRGGLGDEVAAERTAAALGEMERRVRRAGSGHARLTSVA